MVLMRSGVIAGISAAEHWSNTTFWVYRALIWVILRVKALSIASTEPRSTVRIGLVAPSVT